MKLFNLKFGSVGALFMAIVGLSGHAHAHMSNASAQSSNLETATAHLPPTPVVRAAFAKSGNLLTMAAYRAEGISLPCYKNPPTPRIIDTNSKYAGSVVDLHHVCPKADSAQKMEDLKIVMPVILPVKLVDFLPIRSVQPLQAHVLTVEIPSHDDAAQKADQHEAASHHSTHRTKPLRHKHKAIHNRHHHPSAHKPTHISGSVTPDMLGTTFKAAERAVTQHDMANLAARKLAQQANREFRITLKQAVQNLNTHNAVLALAYAQNARDLSGRIYSKRHARRVAANLKITEIKASQHLLKAAA